MPNSIAHAQNYSNLLDEKYKYDSLTAVLDTPADTLKWINADTVNIPQIELDGLGNYSRTSGYVGGAETLTYTPYKLNCDRGRSFQIDEMDDEESVGVAFGQLAGQFLMQRVCPEVDAYRFAKYAGTSGILTGTAVDIVPGTTKCLNLVDDATAAMNDAEVPMEGRILFVSELFYKGIKRDVTRELANENGVQREVLTLDGMRVIRVPKARFNTAITLFNGTSSGETAGGYKAPATTSYPINFMMIHPSAVMQVAKHGKERIFSPDVNQDADAWKYDYRIYHDCFAYANKAKGIYMSKAATANSADIVG